MSIFVGNLPFRAEQEDVAELFAPFGEVANCALPLERDTGRKRGFAFVELVDPDSEDRAIDALQGAELMGRPLRINKAEPRSPGGGGGGAPVAVAMAVAGVIPAVVVMNPTAHLNLGVIVHPVPRAGKTAAMAVRTIPLVKAGPAVAAAATRAISPGGRSRPKTGHRAL